MTQLEQHIYNTFLRISRSSLGKPYKLRQDFSEFEQNEEYPIVQRLARFFLNLPNVNMEEFFAAPYKVYSDNNYHDLSYYLSRNAVKVYSLYKKQQDATDPDNSVILQDILNSIKFIKSFCKDNNIKALDEYLSHKTNQLNTFILHLKERKVNIYVLFGFSRFEEIFYQTSNEVLEFMFPTMITQMGTYRTRYYNSKKCKKLIENGLNLIVKQLR